MTCKCSLSTLPCSPRGLEAALGNSCIAIVYSIATSDASKGTPGDSCISIVYSVATSDTSKGALGDSRSAAKSFVAASELSVEHQYVLESLRSTWIYFFISRWNQSVSPIFRCACSIAYIFGIHLLQPAAIN